jgi:hypothetical protein
MASLTTDAPGDGLSSWKGIFLEPEKDYFLFPSGYTLLLVVGTFRLRVQELFTVVSGKIIR